LLLEGIYLTLQCCFSIGMDNFYGGLTGIILEMVHGHKRSLFYFVVAHFHLVMGISTLYGLFTFVFIMVPESMDE
jgi:cytochrome c oxidase subunit 1